MHSSHNATGEGDKLSAVIEDPKTPSDVDNCLMGCEAVQFDRLTAFERKVLPASSGYPDRGCKYH
jgi:hypothetical protein